MIWNFIGRKAVKFWNQLEDAMILLSVTERELLPCRSRAMSQCCWLALAAACALFLVMNSVAKGGFNKRNIWARND